MKKSVLRHKRAWLSCVIMIGLSIIGVIFLSELGQFLVWRLIGDQMPGIEMKISPDTGMEYQHSVGLFALSKALDVELSYKQIAVEK